MNTHASTTLASWLALSADERLAFERARQALITPAPHPALDPATGIPVATATPAAIPRPEALPAPVGSTAPHQLSLMPLPASAPKRRGRLSPPPVDTELFASATYRAVAGQGGTILVYLAGCAGLAEICALLNAPLYKVGTTSAPIIETRVGGLNQDGYAAYRRCGDNVVAEPGFTSWCAVDLQLYGARVPNSPVSGVGRTLRVALPAGLTHEAFDLLLTERLQPVSLATLAAQPAFRRMCLSRGFAIERLERYTRKRDGSGLSLACELARLTPRWDGDALVELIEGLIADVVGAGSRAGGISPTRRLAAGY